jgi:hypothetical protein
LDKVSKIVLCEDIVHTTHLKENMERKDKLENINIAQGT